MNVIVFGGFDALKDVEKGCFIYSVKLAVNL